MLNARRIQLARGNVSKFHIAIVSYSGGEVVVSFCSLCVIFEPKCISLPHPPLEFLNIVFEFTTTLSCQYFVFFHNFFAYVVFYFKETFDLN